VHITAVRHNTFWLKTQSTESAKEEQVIAQHMVHEEIAVDSHNALVQLQEDKEFIFLSSGQEVNLMSSTCIESLVAEIDGIVSLVSL
jgi:hypothetical protein